MKNIIFLFLLMIVGAACNAQTKPDILDAEFKKFASVNNMFTSENKISFFGDTITARGDSSMKWLEKEIIKFEYVGGIDSLLLKCYNIFRTQVRINSIYERHSKLSFYNPQHHKYTVTFYERPTVAPGKVSIKISILNPKGILSQKWDVEWDRSDLSAYVEKYYRAPNELR